MLPLAEADIRTLSPVALAYIGDAVYELYVRGYFLMPPKHMQTYHRWVVSQVKAERQSQHLQTLMPVLTPPEADVVRRGRNAAPSGNRRANASTYQQATALEALVGYLYLTDPSRLAELLDQLPLEAPPSSPPPPS